MLRLPLFDRARLAFILILAIFYGFRMFPLQMTVISLVGIVSYILFITFMKKDTMDNGRRIRRTDALATAKVFLNDYQDIWKNLRLSNDNCYLILGADGVSIRGVEKKPEANFYRSFKVIKTNIHSMEDVWNMFCKNFSYNKTYDGLIEELGGQHLRSLGYAMGIERLLMVMENQGIEIPKPETCALYVAGLGDNAQVKAFEIINSVRDFGLYAETDVVGRGLRPQMKYADKIGAQFSMVIGDNEIEQGVAKVKNMTTGEQTEITLDETFAEKFSGLQMTAKFADIQE